MNRSHGVPAILGGRGVESHALSTVDLVIAATAQELGTKLATSNTRHFPMFAGLKRPYRS